MSRPTLLPIRLATQCTRQTPPQCLRQRTIYTSLDDQHHHRSRPQRRGFATTPPRCSGVTKQVKPNIKQVAQPSMSRTQKEQQQAVMRAGQLPEDVGLLPDTFILPRKPTERWNWTVRKKWIKMRVTEMAATFMFKYWQVRPRPVLALGSIPSIAADLHGKLMHAFAAGDLSPIAHNNLACSGLLSSLRSRLANRSPQTSQSWSVVKNLSRPKLVSYKSLVFPGPRSEPATEKNAQIQGVVQLHTLQRLQNMKLQTKRESGKGGGRLMTEFVADGNPIEKESLEYVVVQKTMRRGKEGRWMIWGFAEETTLAKVERLAASSQARREGPAKLS